MARPAAAKLLLKSELVANLRPYIEVHGCKFIFFVLSAETPFFIFNKVIAQLKQSTRPDFATSDVEKMMTNDAASGLTDQGEDTTHDGASSDAKPTAKSLLLKHLVKRA